LRNFPTRRYCCFACGAPLPRKPGRRGLQGPVHRTARSVRPLRLVAALQCDPRRRSRSSSPPGPTHSPSAFWDATSTVDTAELAHEPALRDDAPVYSRPVVTPDEPGADCVAAGSELVGSSTTTAHPRMGRSTCSRWEGPRLEDRFIRTAMHSEVSNYIRPWTTVTRSTQAMEDRRYRELGGVLQHVLRCDPKVYERASGSSW